MNDKYTIAVVAFVVGLIVAKGMKPSASNTQEHNETKTTGQWWTYAGGWSL